MDYLYVTNSMYANYFLTHTKGNKVVNRALMTRKYKNWRFLLDHLIKH
jgi:hypothetical protein